MINKAADTIRRYSLIGEGETVVAGVSGGADSVALLLVLLKLAPQMKFSVCAAHLNHGIRGESADADEHFVRELCEFYGVMLYCERADIPKIARENGETLEQAGRNIRYEFLERARLHFSAQQIAVAHHMDDQAESILLHLTRGTGLAGLTGMQPRRERIIRPLLFLRRHEIEGFLEAEETVYCTDETNLVSSGTRNRLRLDVIPYIEKNINPSIVNALCSMGELLMADEQYLIGIAVSELEKCRSMGGYLREKLLVLEKPILTRAIRIALKNAGALTDIERIHVEKVIELLGARTGAALHLPHIDAWVSYELICFGKLENFEPFCVPLDMFGATETPIGYFTAELIEGNEYEKDPFTAYLDADKLSGKLCVRTRISGDRFFPLGSPGTRKLKEFFIDKKVPRNERVLPLVCSGADVLFVPGYGISENVKVTGETKQMLRLAYTDIKIYTR